MAFWIILLSVFIKDALSISDNSTKGVNHESTNTIECPRICRCHMTANLEIVSNCSASNISVLPTDISQKTTKLILNNNFLGRSVNQTLTFKNLTHLSYLDLSHNVLSKLENNTFIGLKKLRFLSLAYNRLGYPKCLADGIFKPLLRLQDLRIHVNCQKYDPNCTYHDTEIADLKSLRRLTVDGLQQPTLGRGFLKLRELRYLWFYHQESVIGKITPRTFSNLANSKLVTLIMRGTHVDQVLPGSFSMLKHLSTLDLSENNQLCTDGMKNVSMGLNQTMVQMLLFGSTCHHGQDISGNTLVSIRGSSLIYLDISNSKVRNISAMFILNLPKTLRFFMLQYNIISDVRFVLFGLTMPSLEYLDGSGQNHFADRSNVLKTNIFKKNTIADNSDTLMREQEQFLRQTGLSADPLRSYSKSSSKLRTNILRSNISTIGKDDKHSAHNFNHIPWPNPFPLPPKLRFVNVSYLGVVIHVTSANATKNNSLETLDVSNGKFKRINGMITGLHSLKFLNLSVNEIEYLSPVTFSDTPALVDLNLSFNRFGKSINESASEIFIHLRNLTFLDLSDTGLKKLPMKIFSGNRLLKVLKLASNGFETITFSLEFLDNLVYLDLSYNNIVFIQSETATQLTSLSLSHAINIYLNGNSIKCNCDYKSFVDWLAHLNNHLILSGNPSLKCSYISGSLIKVSSLKTKWTAYNIECVTWEVMTSCTLGFFVLLIVLTSVACIYTQRWKLRYLYYTGRKTINPYHPLLGERVNLESDCYFSFDESEQLSIGDNRETTMYNFVTEIVFPYLHQQKQELRVSFRGALADNLPLYQTISQAIRCSKKVVVVLSSQYCNEYWNLFEFNMAAYEGMYTNRDVVVLVVVGDLSPQDVTGDVRAFIAGRNVLHLKPNCNYSVLLDQIIQRISR